MIKVITVAGLKFSEIYTSLLVVAGGSLFASENIPTSPSRTGYIINPKTKEFVYLLEVKDIIDVTKAPNFADNTGKQDRTAALIRAFDDILREDYQLIQEARPIVCGVKKAGQGKQTVALG